ncbi:hypothetical protein TEA_001839 [Camellia sinensis var. sinensis]|uniref:C3H1-type domain-containing protein n=1 Tax=Camellia sinensis var. sinensis TaxID=542762 RepID=A0A4S4DRL2_CAMSN|nr:hypothetical protein TEA_001839 [Camellia sinensis var. sinensis]
MLSGCAKTDLRVLLLSVETLLLTREPVPNFSLLSCCLIFARSDLSLLYSFGHEDASIVAEIDVNAPLCSSIPNGLLILKTIKQFVEPRNSVQFAYRSLMAPYLPQSGAGGGGSPYSEGGALYALGLIHANHGEGIKQFLRDSLCSTNVEVIQHGACLGLGLAALGTADEDIYDDVKLCFGVQPCALYLQNGYCKFGRTCKFDHPMGTVRYSPSASSLTDMSVAPYMVGPSLATMAPSFLFQGLTPIQVECLLIETLQVVQLV